VSNDIEIEFIDKKDESYLNNDADLPSEIENKNTANIEMNKLINNEDVNEFDVEEM
jgi:hypothetical protein